jgi:hypothetical protein
MKKEIRTLVSLMILAGLILAVAPDTAAAVNGKLEASLKAIAKQRKIAEEDLETVNTVEVSLPLSGMRFTSSKVLDRTTGEFFEVSVDADGRTVNSRELGEREDQLYRERYGKLTPELYDALRGRAATDVVAIGLWIGLSDLADGNDLKTGNLDVSEEETDELSRQRDTQVSEAVQRNTESVVAALRASGLEPQTFEFSPIIVVKMRVQDVPKFAANSRVSQVLLAEGKLIDYLYQSARTISANFLWGIGTTGTGARVAVVEGGAVSFANPFLTAIGLGTCGNPYGTGGIADHPTVVAGIVASQHGTHRGIANGARVFSAPGWYSSNPSLLYAMDCGAANTHISNNSWGYGVAPAFPDIFTTHADFIVRDRWDQLVAAAGNNPGTRANAVAGGFNTIAVGSIRDQKTGLNLTDDVMSSFSTYQNPNACYLCGTWVVGDFEKPEVVAPGENIISTRLGGAVSNAGSGTSYASPMIAGVDALIQSLNPGLAIYPETKRSIILASARNNIEGAPSMSDRDGASLVDSVTAYQTTVNNRFDWKCIHCAGTTPFNAFGDYYVTLPAIPSGGKIKVAYNWLSNANGTWNSTSDRLEYDLDMTVYDPSNNIVGGSYKWSDSKEVVQFTANVAGNYKVRIHRYSTCPNPRFTYAALAWSIN